DMMREALTLDNYAAIFRDAFFRNVLMRTIVVAVISTAVALVLALPVAYFIARAPARWKSLLIILVVFPVLVGNLVRAAGWMAVMGNRGFVNQLLLGFGLIEQPLEILYTPTAVVIGIIAVVLPFMTLTLQSVLEQIDPSLEEAAGSLGARPFTAFRRVVLPPAHGQDDGGGRARCAGVPRQRFLSVGDQFSRRRADLGAADRHHRAARGRSVRDHERALHQSPAPGARARHHVGRRGHDLQR